MTDQEETKPDVPDRAEGRPRRRWWLLFAGLSFALVLICAGALGFAWTNRIALARPHVDQALRDLGLTSFDYEISSLGLAHAELQSVRLGSADDPTVTLGEARILFRLQELLSGRVRSVVLRHLDVALRVDEQGLNLGALAPLTVGSGGGPRVSLPPVTLEGARLTIEDASGAYHVSASGELIERDGTISLELRDDCAAFATSRLSFGAVRIDPIETRACLQLTEPLTPSVLEPVSMTIDPVLLNIADRSGTELAVIRLPQLALTADASDLSVQARLQGAHVNLPSQALGFEDLGLRVQADFSEPPYGASWYLDQGTVTDMGHPARFAPLVVQGSGSADLDTIEFELLTFDDKTRSLLASLTGRHEVVSGQGQASFLAGPLSFQPDVLQPQDLVPALKGLITNVAGSADGDGQVQWTVRGVSGSGRFDIADMALSTAAARVSGLNGTINFSELLPLRTDGIQTVSIGLVDAGFELSNGEALFSLDADGSVQVERAHWPFAGGEIELSAGHIVPGARDHRFELTVRGVDLGEFIQVFNLDGASGSGTVHGTIPIVVSDGDPIIEGGVLRTEGAGRLAYQNAGTDAVGGGQSSLVFEALKDFHYTNLELGLDGNAQDRLTVRLNLQGANPQLYDGYPFVINVNTEASFAELIRSGTVGMRALEVIEADRDSGESGR